MNRKPTHLLVDLDGTLLGSAGRLRLSFVYHALRHLGGRGIRPLRAFRGLHAMRIALETPGTHLLNRERAAVAFGEIVGLAPEEASGLLETMVAEVFPKLERHFHPIEGAARFLEWARGEFRLTLATNPVWPIGIVLLRLRWAGVDPALFELITHAGNMHACKPSLEYYREVLQALRLPAEDSLLIGDSARKDLPAARAGVGVFLLGPSGGVAQLSERAWTGDFASLRKFLERQGTDG